MLSFTPNPGEDQFFVRTALKNCQIIVYDVSGKQIITKQLHGLVTSVDMNNFPPGHYPYRLQLQGSKIISGIWIKQE